VTAMATSPHHYRHTLPPKRRSSGGTHPPPLMPMPCRHPYHSIHGQISSPRQHRCRLLHTARTTTRNTSSDTHGMDFGSFRCRATGHRRMLKNMPEVHPPPPITGPRDTHLHGQPIYHLAVLPPHNRSRPGTGMHYTHHRHIPPPPGQPNHHSLGPWSHRHPRQRRS
jgi:hypothetical protein